MLGARMIHNLELIIQEMLDRSGSNQVWARLELRVIAYLVYRRIKCL